MFGQQRYKSAHKVKSNFHMKGKIGLQFYIVCLWDSEKFFCQKEMAAKPKLNTFVVDLFLESIFWLFSTSLLKNL